MINQLAQAVYVLTRQANDWWQPAEVLPQREQLSLSVTPVKSFYFFSPSTTKFLTAGEKGEDIFREKLFKFRQDEISWSFSSGALSAYHSHWNGELIHAVLLVFKHKGALHHLFIITQVAEISFLFKVTGLNSGFAQKMISLYFLGFYW